MYIGSGGGYNSKVVNRSTDLKREPITKKIDVQGVAEIGSSLGYRGANWTGSGPGYPVAAVRNTAAQGPGSNRHVMRSGSQGLHGSPSQGSKASAPDVPATKPGRDILGMYGKDKR
jgi:hypothetical protein